MGLYLGIDTSNYTTSCALYNSETGEIVQKKKLLPVKEGGKKVKATFAGPSCDSLDIMFRGKMTAQLEVGDLLLVPACGAYTSASATTFNGFRRTEFVIWEQVKKELELSKAPSVFESKAVAAAL